MQVEALLNNCLEDILNMTFETQEIRTQRITNLFLKLPLPLNCRIIILLQDNHWLHLVAVLVINIVGRYVE